MDAPVIVLREEGRLVAALPLAELFQMQRAARQIMYAALGGDREAASQVDTVFGHAASLHNPERGRAFVSVMLLCEAMREWQEMRDAAQAQQAQAKAQAPQDAAPEDADQPAAAAPRPQRRAPEEVPLCGHGRPTDIPCPECPAASVAAGAA